MNCQLDGVIIIDKPPDFSSQGVITRLRRVLRGVKMGHSGTLDPMATGVLPIFLQHSTRLTQFYLHRPKEYEGVIRLGWATDTHDRLGTPLGEPAAVRCGREEVEGWVGSLQGEISQALPAFSSAKWKGKAFYAYARKGKTVPHRERLVHVDHFEVLRWEPPALMFRVRCSGGTYIRSLAHELGRLAGCGAHLANLCRTVAEPFRLAQGVGLTEACQHPAVLEERLIPKEALLPEWPACTCADPEIERRVRQGNPVRLPCPAPAVPGDRWRLFGASGELLAIGRVQAVEGGFGLVHPNVVLV